MSRVIENPKQLILSKAKEILYKEGYSKLSMRSLSKACDIALGTIYNYYPGKKELILEMMSDYWQEFINLVENIGASDMNFYVMLSEIFKELKVFIQRFRQYWLTPELYSSPEYVENGLMKEYAFMERLVNLVGDILIKEQGRQSIHVKLGTRETASFIIMNFITMVQMPMFQYEAFELFLKELLD